MGTFYSPLYTTRIYTYNLRIIPEAYSKGASLVNLSSGDRSISQFIVLPAAHISALAIANISQAKR